MQTKSNRRSFLVSTGLTALAATRVMGANERLQVGAIGTGGRMRTLLKSADKAAPYDFVAACDVYGPHLDEVKQRVNPPATTHIDYHEVLEKPVDAVIIAAPDHWHVRMASDALAAGKDVYLEKPVTHSIEEGAILARAVANSNKRILQCGMQQRSWRHFQSAVELIQGGNIGRITKVRTYWYQNYQTDWPAEPINVQQLDWKRWLGSAPEQPFSEEKFRRWRWFWDFGGGAMTDLFAHWIDVVHWAMKESEPSVAQMLGDRYYFTQWQCPDTLQAGFRYPGFEVGYEGTMVSSIDDGGLEFRGTEGTIKLTRSGYELYREGVGKANPIAMEHAYDDGTIDHMRNFFDCVKSRDVPNAPVETGIAAARAGQLGNLAMKRGGQITWPLRPSAA